MCAKSAFHLQMSSLIWHCYTVPSPHLTCLVASSSIPQVARPPGLSKTPCDRCCWRFIDVLQWLSEFLYLYLLRVLSLNSYESESHSVVSDSLRPHGLYSPWNSPGQNTGVGSLSLLQGIFPTQGSNPGLSHCRRILHQLSHKGSPTNSYRFLSNIFLHLFK